MIERIVLLTGSGFAQHVNSGGTQLISVRESKRFDDLLNGLSKEIEAPVILSEENYEYSKEEILICRPDVFEQVIASTPEPKSVASNCIVIDVTRGEALQIAESKSLAAVVDSAVYSQWIINYPKAEVVLYGLRQFQAVLGCDISSNPDDNSENYVKYVAQSGSDLPEFLARYIRVLI